MALYNVLDLRDSVDGNRIKQGDLSNMRYILTDANNDDLKMDGMPAVVYLYTTDSVQYQFKTKVKRITDTLDKSKYNYAVDIVINQVIPADEYMLEIHVNEEYIFPSDHSAIIEVTESVLGKSLSIADNEAVYDAIIQYGLANGKFKLTADSSVVLNNGKSVTVKREEITDSNGRHGVRLDFYEYTDSKLGDIINTAYIYDGIDGKTPTLLQEPVVDELGKQTGVILTTLDGDGNVTSKQTIRNGSDIKTDVMSNYLNSKDLFNKPPVDVLYDDFASDINDDNYNGIVRPKKTSDGKTIHVEPNKWFFYSIKTDNFTQDSISLMVKVLKKSAASKVEFRVLDKDQTYAPLIPLDLENVETNVYSKIDYPITKGQIVEFRFDNRGNDDEMIIYNPVMFEGGNNTRSDSDIVNLNYKIDKLKQTISKVSTIADTAEQKAINAKKISGLSVFTPKDFTVKNHLLVDKILTDGKGNFHANYDITENKLKGGTTYFVNANSGNDSNDGLSKGQPFLTISAAYSKMKDNDTLIIAEGNYFRSLPSYINKSINLIGETNNVNIIMADKPNWTKESGYNNVYSFNRSSTDSVINLSYGFTLKKVNSIPEVEAQKGAWYTNGTKVYINTFDNVENYVPLIAAYNFRSNSLSSDIYLENLNFFGGKSCVHLELSASNNAYFNKCSFNNAGYYNGLTIIGGNNVVSNNCTAAYNGLDGFNYHISSAGVKPFVIEIDCKAFMNGTDKGTAGFKSNNGSTIHDGLKCIRVNGIYARNDGGNIADVGEGTETWNLGCSAFESYQGKDFQISSGAKFWLDSCVGYGSENSINVGSADCTAYTRNGEYQNILMAGTHIKY